MAICQVRTGSRITEDEVVALVAERLGSYKKPGMVRLTSDPLPKSPTGKLQRKVLREPYWTGRDVRVGGA
jgi:acyl-CoA synthetase (AMP-forming)/AMP-acid ligase II